MDDVYGWNEAAGSDDAEMGGSGAATRNGQRNVVEFRNWKKNTMMEAVSWPCLNVLPNHERVFLKFTSMTMIERDILERLKFDIDVPPSFRIPPHKSKLGLGQ